MQDKLKSEEATHPILRAARAAVRTASVIGFCWLSLSSSAQALYPTYPAPCHPTPYEKNWGYNFLGDMGSDFSRHFQNENLIYLGDSILAAGVLANTGMDRSFSDHWQTDIRTKGTDNFFKPFNNIGSLSVYFFPIYLTSMSVGHLREHTLMGNVAYAWGYRSLRTYILGGIQQVILTNLLGGGRPSNNADSKWQPFRYCTGVSGHSFAGAIPFITAAQMAEPPLLKYGLYVISTLPGFARVNKNAHYLSQAFLGWTLAFLSARSVYQTDLERNPTFQVGVYPRSDGAMLAARLEF